VYGPGVCYLASLAGVLGAYDSQLGVTKVIFYSGPIYEKWQEIHNGKTEIIRAPARPPTIFLRTLDNLGYRAYVGYNERGFRELKKTYLRDEEKERHQEFKTEDEAFSFLKRIISSAIPVIVHIDPEFIGETPGSDFVVVTGYDKKNVYINYSAEEGGKDRPVKVADFLKAWSSGEAAKTPNLMLFVEQVNKEKPDVEILAEIRKECRVISTYLNEDADGLEKGKIPAKNFKFFGDLGSAKRSALAIFLEMKNFNDIAENYNKIAKLYAEIRPETDPKELVKKLREIAKQEKEASANWK
jgi:hypothetical protein